MAEPFGHRTAVIALTRLYIVAMYGLDPQSTSNFKTEPPWNLIDRLKTENNHKLAILLPQSPCICNPPDEDQIEDRSWDRTDNSYRKSPS